MAYLASFGVGGLLFVLCSLLGYDDIDIDHENDEAEEAGALAEFNS